MKIRPEFLVRSEVELEGLYDAPLERSVKKQLTHIDELARSFIAASPLVVIGTQGGVADCSPRGDAPGFVKVADERTLLIPDRRGNNRTDTLHNLVSNGATGLVFFVPGRNETFRVNGDAVISRDPELLAQFEVQGKQPRTVMIVTVREAYIHCSRALVRANLWDSQTFAAGAAVPTFGEFLEAHTKGFVQAKELDEELKVRVPLTLY